MPLNNCDHVEKAIRQLKAPNEFELYEYISYSRNMNIEKFDFYWIRIIISNLLKENKIFACTTKIRRYPHRYISSENKPFCILEPAILQNNSSEEIVKESKKVLEVGKESFNSYELIKDSNREIVFAVMDNTLAGVIDFRRSKPIIRLPTHFNKRIDIPGMTELRYFSCLYRNQNFFAQIDWLNINCLGYSICN